MKTDKFLSPKKILEVKSDIIYISKKLTDKQKEVIQLLQEKEVLIISDSKKVFVTCGKSEKKVSFHSFYALVNNGLIHQTEQPANYVLSPTGKKIIIV